MTDNQPYDPHVIGRRDDGDRWPLPVPMRHVRTKLAGFATLSLLALALDLPLVSQIALLTGTVAIPVAVALHGGRRLLRTLFAGPAVRSCGAVRSGDAVRSHGAVRSQGAVRSHGA